LYGLRALTTGTLIPFYTSQIDALVSTFEPDLVGAHAPGVHDGPGRYVDHVAAARHQMVARDQSQSGRTASGGELFRDRHGHGIDLIHFSVGVSHVAGIAR
jgi:hypothetical protein